MPSDPHAATTGPLGDSEETWPVAATRDLHRDDWVVALRRDEVRLPGDEDGPTFGRLVLEHPGAVVVLAIDADERVLVLLQYRHPGRHRFVELPAGLIDKVGEAPVEVARRELREEAALEAADWADLGTAYSSPGISDELIHYFVARGLTEVDRDFAPDHEEADMEARWVPFAELYDAVLAGRARDAPLALAVLLAHARGLAGSAGGGR
ncbi:NUDIX hydrolase [Nocardioides sp. 503]|uniref:NUDIX domain-containing protein n=1 Tax=Nocardioides sp. 503 TaxID=2508326 RepID=UPI00106F989D|nr:NUDIX hydrolase [Nocardioides sp. 503]